MERACPRWSGTSRTCASARAIPNYYVARLASKFVKVVLTGSGGDELFAGYPWRYYPGGRQRRLRRLRREVLPLLAPAGPQRRAAGLLPPEVWSEVRDLRTIDIFRRRSRPRRAPRRPEEYVDHSLYLEAKTFLHGLLRGRGQAQHGAQPRDRVPFLDNDLVDFAQRLPVRHEAARPRARRAAERERAGAEDGGATSTRPATASCCCEGDEPLRPGRDHQPGEAGLLGPRRELVPGRQHRLRPPGADIARRRDLRVPRARRACSPSFDEHLEGRENRRLLLWSLLSFEFLPAVSTPIPHSRTVLAAEDIDAAVSALRSGQLVASEVTEELERTIADLLSRRYAWAAGKEPPRCTRPFVAWNRKRRRGPRSDLRLR